MAFTDPQTVTIGTVPGAVTLPRVSTGTQTGAFVNYDSKVRLEILPSYGKRSRKTSSLSYQKVVTDPLVSTTNVLVSGTVRLIIDMPNSGFSATEQKELVLAHINALTASSNAGLIKLIAGEN